MTLANAQTLANAKPANLRIASVTAAVLLVLSLSSAHAQQGKLAVDWSDKEIKSYVDGQTKSRSLKPDQEGQLSKLKLPALAFDAAPALVTRSLGPQADAQFDRQVVVDDDQESYSIIDQFGPNKEITITVSASLKVQHKFPADYPVYQSQARGANIAPDAPSVSVEESEIGSDGVYADYTVMKFPSIPYTVRIECTGATKKECRDVAAIALDSKQLKIISARPPQ